MGKDFRLLFLLFFTLSFAWAEEPFRTFKTPQGKSFEGKVVGYEGQTFILSNKAGALFKVPFNALSNEDKSYLIEAVQQNRIPKGTPPPPVPSAASSSPPASQGSTAQGIDATVSKDNEKAGTQGDGIIHKAPPKKKSRLQKRFFFRPCTRTSWRQPRRGFGQVARFETQAR